MIRRLGGMFTYIWTCASDTNGKPFYSMKDIRCLSYVNVCVHTHTHTHTHVRKHKHAHAHKEIHTQTYVRMRFVRVVCNSMEEVRAC